jgi:hypothetical protein
LDASNRRSPRNKTGDIKKIGYRKSPTIASVLCHGIFVTIFVAKFAISFIEFITLLPKLVKKAMWINTQVIL